jgi:ketosteroid isomerase-like protein
MQDWESQARRKGLTVPDNEAIVRRYFDGCETGDAKTIESTLDPDVVHYFLARDRPPIRGAEHLARFWSKMKGAVNAHWAVDHAIAVGDEVVLEWSLYWTHPQLGTRFVNRGTDWYVLRVGRICEVRAYNYFPATAPPMESDSELTGFPYKERAYLLESV